MGKPLTIEQLRRELQSTDVLCFLDTEFNSKEEQIGAVEEIIMLSAIYMNGNGEILENYTTWVKPIVSCQLASMIQQVCQITMEELAQKPNMIEVLSALEQRAKRWQPQYYICWGEQDRRVIAKSADYCCGQEVCQPLLVKMRDGQQMFMRYFMGEKYCKRNLLSLEYCVRQCGIDFTHRFDAEEDALSMGKMFSAILQGQLNEDKIKQEVIALIKQREQQQVQHQKRSKKVSEEYRLQAQLQQLQGKQALYRKNLMQLQNALEENQLQRQQMRDILPKAGNKVHWEKLAKQRKMTWEQKLQKAEVIQEKEMIRLCHQKLAEIKGERELYRQYGILKNNRDNLRAKMNSQKQRLRKVNLEIQEKQQALQELTLLNKQDKMEKVM